MAARNTLVACVLLTALVVTAVLPISISGSSIYLYLYGATWCPHCRTLDQFLSQTYSGSYHFCKVDVLESCRTSFNSVRSLLISKGVSQKHLEGIPQTYVVRDGRYLLAIVVGAVTDTQFWRNLTSRGPQERVLLVVPPNAYEIPISFSEQYEIVSKYIAAATPKETATPTEIFSSYTLVPIVLIAAGVSIVVYAFIKRRK
ncbi:MAG: thioredoxin family protein [Sulfolobales archaeon]|nr:thioredoxin family protein [Sulfolobales archaeon]MDW8082556.1 thioredoxin family protein [Sulfolobales archaeon]